MKIMLIDDCTGDVLLFRRALRNVLPNAELHAEGSAESGLTHLTRALDAQQPFDCLFVDYNLPGMSGGALIDQISSDARMSPMRIFLMSSAIDAIPDDHGATRRLQKPFGGNGYVDLIRDAQPKRHIS